MINRQTKPHGWLRRAILCVLIFVLLIIGAIVVCYIAVSHTAEGRTYNNLDEMPYRKVGLVLGTTPRLSNGNGNFYFNKRMEATAALYHKHKISYILASGDNHKRGYNEPEEMRQSLIALGVPDTVIFLDYAGFRTYDSMIRAKKVFGQDSVTIISQTWHNQRAVFIAKHRDLDAIAYNAQDSKLKRAYLKMHLREALSRVKAVLDVMTNKKPKFLGEPIEIR